MRDVDTGQDLPDHLKWVKFSSASWTQGRQRLLLQPLRRAEAGRRKLKGVNYFQKLYFHRLGTPQSEDTLIYERHDQKEWGFGGDVTDDGRYLSSRLRRGRTTKNQFFYKDLSDSRTRRSSSCSTTSTPSTTSSTTTARLLVHHRPECAARPGHRHRRPQARPRELEGVIPEAAGHAARRQRGRRPVHLRLSEGRAQRR